VIDLTGKSALVTGGSRGIGRAMAIRRATQRAGVAFTAVAYTHLRAHET
jgi:NAD(P)-dependent dehydrogenase (short-subunit alcohol dehydrogenase family)